MIYSGKVFHVRRDIRQLRVIGSVTYGALEKPIDTHNHQASPTPGLAFPHEFPRDGRLVSVDNQ